MSGFICIYNLDGTPVDSTLLERMTAFMSFRGPDEQQTWIEGEVGLGHALLRTVFEQDQERQPITVDGNTWITGDIRLDGRAELLGKLGGHGRKLEVNAPDVELLLHAYNLWGESCLDHISGDFAFALWDGIERRLWCARDQFGVVPLYYAQAGQCLLLSNTLNCVKLHPGISDNLNEQAIGDFLLVGMNYDTTSTTFADIKRLPPAHTLECNRGGLRLRQYWALPEHNAYVTRRPDDCVEQFRELFDQAVGDRLRTRRLSTHLSGGMDSTSIAVTAQRLLAKGNQPFELRAFTGVAETLIPDDERRYAARVAEAAGLPVEYLQVEDYLSRTPKESPDFVLQEPCTIPETQTMLEMHLRATRQGRVVLSGLGGDPLFSQPPDYWPNLLRNGRLGLWLRGLLRYWRVYRSMPPLGIRSRLLRRWQRTRPERPFPHWINVDFARRCQLQERHKYLQHFTEQYDQQHGMAVSPFWSNVFAWTDPGFTSLPLKFRFPFFDLRLFRYVLSVPPVIWITDKRLLRAAMVGRLPEEVRLRPKKTHAVSPEQELPRQRGTPHWRLSLAALPELAEYIEPRFLQAALAEPGQMSLREYREIVSWSLALAYWLRYRCHAGPSVVQF